MILSEDWKDALWDKSVPAAPRTVTLQWFAQQIRRKGDIAEVQTSEGKPFLFVGIDRTSKFAVTQLVEKADRKTAWEFRRQMLEAVPYQLHTILTDNGVHFAEQPRQTDRPNG